jgi:hypothetical protein
MSRCDDYCCNHGCNQGRDCPARKAPFVQYKTHFNELGEPINEPPYTWHDLVIFAIFVGLAVAFAMGVV